MTSNFHSFLNTFSREAGLEWKEGLNAGEASIDIEGYPLNLVYFEKTGILMALAIVAVLPEDEKARTQFMERLLCMNTGFAGTGGGSIGIDPQENAVTFQISWPFDGMTQDSFASFVTNAVSLAAQVMQTLAAENQGGDAENSGEQTVLAKGMIRA